MWVSNPQRALWPTTVRIFIRKVRKKMGKDPTRPEILVIELGVAIA
jgi:hypothetical protein